MWIGAPYDSGNIEVLDASDPADVRLRIREDAAAPFRQWFYFRVLGARGRPLSLRIQEVDRSSYPRGWEGYRAVGRDGDGGWVRLPTALIDGELRIACTPTTDALEVAYFAPYPLGRHRRLIARAAGRGAAVSRLCVTPDGHDLELLRVGAAGGVPVWIVARQHPGEAMAEWFVEGLLDRLFDRDDALAAALLARAELRIVPNMNPDGTRRGHLRTNARGTDLNRAWHDPDPERAPEVFAALSAMEAERPRLVLDVHGDEEIPHNFVSGAEGTPSWNPWLAGLQGRFLDRWVSVNPDFQTRVGYPPGAPGAANLTLCTNQLSERFGALSMTVEMPFKDALERPDPVRGWSPGRARALGASVIDPILAVLPELA